MRRYIAALVLVLPLLGGCAAGTTPTPSAPAAAVGKVIFLDFADGFIVADFDGRRMVIGLDKREIGSYAPGDEIRIDSAGRPLPRN